MTQKRNIRTLKDTNYFSHGTYKREYRDYMYQIGFVHMLARTILAPLQRWRIIKQTQQTYPLRPLVFKNIIEYVSRIPKQQGITAFWRGNMAGLWLFFTQSIIQVGFYDNMRRLIKDLNMEEEPGSLFTMASERVVIPIMTSFFTQIFTFPIDTARVRITMNYTKQKSKAPFTGIRTCLKHLRSEQNFSAMYKGFLLSNMISLINFNFYLVFSDLTSKIELGTNDSQLITPEVIASVAALVVIHPLDTLKKIVQLDNLSSPSMIKNGRQALEYLKRTNGYSALYNGMLISIVKSFMFLPAFYVARQFLAEVEKHTQF